MPSTSQKTTIRILLFGPMAKAAEAASIELAIDGGQTTLHALRYLITASHPALAAMLPSHRFAVNSQFARDDQTVTSSDEIALIGMVSGG